MDKKLMIHAGAELAVATGMFYYFNKRISALEMENRLLAKELNLIKGVMVQNSSVQNEQPKTPLGPIDQGFSEAELDKELEEEFKNDDKADSVGNGCSTDID